MRFECDGRVATNETRMEHGRESASDRCSIRGFAFVFFCGSCLLVASRRLFRTALYHTLILCQLVLTIAVRGVGASAWRGRGCAARRMVRLVGRRNGPQNGNGSQVVWP